MVTTYDEPQVLSLGQQSTQASLPSGKCVCATQHLQMHQLTPGPLTASSLAGFAHRLGAANKRAFLAFCSTSTTTSRDEVLSPAASCASSVVRGPVLPAADRDMLATQPAPPNACVAARAQELLTLAQAKEPPRGWLMRRCSLPPPNRLAAAAASRILLLEREEKGVDTDTAMGALDEIEEYLNLPSTNLSCEDTLAARLAPYEYYAARAPEPACCPATGAPPDTPTLRAADADAEPAWLTEAERLLVATRSPPPQSRPAAVAKAVPNRRQAAAE